MLNGIFGHILVFSDHSLLNLMCGQIERFNSLFSLHIADAAAVVPLCRYTVMH